MRTMSVEEAVARYFPTGTGYDHTQAQRLIGWLDKCGYVIAPKEAKKHPKPRALKAA